MVGRTVSGTKRAANCATEKKELKPCLRKGARLAKFGNQVKFCENVFRIMITASDDSYLWPIVQKARKEEGRPPAKMHSKEHNLLSSAMALRNAKELALKLEEPISTGFGWPIVWEEREAIVCVPYAERNMDHNDLPEMPLKMSRGLAVRRYYSNWYEYEHFGEVPAFKDDNRDHTNTTTTPT